jgi:serine/threonine protein kinase/class 3 adenylate cyclase
VQVGGVRVGTDVFVPRRQVSSGRDGTALAARSRITDGQVQLHHAAVEQTDPVRWAVIDDRAKQYALLEHPTFLRLLRRGVVDGTPVLVFKGGPGRSLHDRVGVGRLPVLDVNALGMRLMDALTFAHALGFVHGHIRPSAVHLCDDGTPLLGFEWLDVGQPHTDLDDACTPPEATREALDAAADVFALGMLMRILLLGRAPSTHDGFGAFGALLEHMTMPEPEMRPRMHEAHRALHALAPEIERRSRAAEAEQHTTPRQLPVNLEWDDRPDERVGSRMLTGTQLGRFTLTEKLGEGGMGEVYRAIDRATGLPAAIKVLHMHAGRDPKKVQRFRKEARVLMQLSSPHIAKLLEVNRDAGVDFIALEFVDGYDLSEYQQTQGGRLPEREALAIAADVCRGLAQAHARGIVHRDIKPENVMIARTSDAHGGHAAKRVKVCDFGIARVLDARDGTLAFTQDDHVLGTPHFMAPEQCDGSSLSPATDVYALGVTLFLLVSGRTPFESNETLGLLLAHTTKEPPSLSSVCPEVSDATSELVARMLKKAPADRFVDASMALEAIERILRGEPTSIDVHPVRPETPSERIVTHVFEWELRSSAQALWPFVSNTDRLNRAVGLPPASYERSDDGEEVVTQGTNRVAGLSLRWREHPFEWVEGRRWGVLRTFDRGIMRWFTIELSLTPLASGGTRLRYAMTYEPRHVFARLIVAFEMRGKQRAALGKAFARIDAFAGNALIVPGSDAFETSETLSDEKRALLERGLAKLRDDGAQEAVVEALGAFCELAPSQQAARLRPLAFARLHGLSPDHVVDACLRAAHHGMLHLLWDILCPVCRVPSDFVGSLQALKDHGRCSSCNVEFPLDFGQSVELVFRVAPELRDSEQRTYCIGGPAFAPHVVAQVRLAAQERLELNLALGSGLYSVRSPQLPSAFALDISPSARLQRASFRFARGAADDERALLRPGAQSLGVQNLLEHEIVVRVERAAPREDALTAARAACLASFRKLFPGEVLATGRLVSVGRTAFVVASLHDQRGLLSELGDARAFERLLTVLSMLEEIVAEEGGAVVKTAAGATLCAFSASAPAIRTALALRRRLHALLNAPDVRIAVHQGPSVTATFDGRLDYFGQTVERAMDLCAHAPKDRVLLSSTLAQDPGTLRELKAEDCESEAAALESDLGYGLVVLPN